MSDRPEQVFVRSLRADTAFASCQVGGNDLSDSRVVEINQSIQLFPMTGLATAILEDSLPFYERFFIRRNVNDFFWNNVNTLQTRFTERIQNDIG